MIVDMNRTRRGFVTAVAGVSVVGVAAGDEEPFDPEISIGSDYLSARVESDLDPDRISIHTADGTVHEFTENTGRFEGGYMRVTDEHHIGDGWYGIIERVEAHRGDRTVVVTNDEETTLDVTCSLWNTPESRPQDFRMEYEHARKMYDPPVGDEPAYGSPGRVLQSVRDVNWQLWIEFDNRQQCEPDEDKAVTFDCTSVTVHPEEFVNGTEAIYRPELTFLDETKEEIGDSDEQFEPPETFEGTGENEGKVVRKLHFWNDPGGEANFTYLNPDADDCDSVEVIDPPAVIDEPGEYELVEDYDGEAVEFDEFYDAACLWIRASGVTLQGNGHTLTGEGSGFGIMVGDQGRDVTKDVTIRELDVQNWETGISLGSDREWRTQTVLESVSAVENENRGMFLFTADGSQLRDVTADRNGGRGIHLWETNDLDFENVTVAENEGHGLYFHDIVGRSEFVDIDVIDNENDGIRMGIDVGTNTFTGLTVAGNDGAGIRSFDGGENRLQQAVIEDNAGDGIELRSSGKELDEVTIRGNGGWQVDGRNDSSVTATELEVGDSATIEASAEPIALDAVDEDELPDLPVEMRPLSDGIEVDAIDDSLEMTLQYDVDNVEREQIEVRLHDGDTWLLVSEERADGTVSFPVSNDGVYVPVERERTEQEEGSEDDVEQDEQDGEDEGDEGDDSDETDDEQADDGDAGDDTNEETEGGDGESDESETSAEDEDAATSEGDENSEDTESANSSTERVEPEEADGTQNGTSDDEEYTPIADADSTSVDTPGLGVASGLAALGGASYLSVRRLRDGGEDGEQKES